MDLLYKMAITRIPKVGGVLAKNLISYCGGAEAVFHANKKELLKVPGIGPAIANNILTQQVLYEAEAEMEWVQKNDIQALFYLDENYPQRLRHYDESPLMLYYKGTAELNAERVVAVVGTRSPTSRGKAICEDIVDGLKDYNVLVVSGLAYGIDITAHRQCIQSGIPTIGVLGHGLDKVYPAEHQQTALDMMEQGGVLTEFSYKTEPNRQHFPMRNRIIAGMCDALLVIETAQRGGSMISAELANAYNKDVFAVPGRIKDKASKGCNHLIKTHKAALLEKAEDIAYIMRWEKGENKSGVQKQLFVELTETEQKVVDILQKADETGIDELTFQAGINPSQLSSILLNLEFKGMVKSLPGKRFMLC